MLSIVELGLRPYQEVWALQKEMIAQRREGLIPDTLILTEHPPVLTTGRAFRPESLPFAPSVPVYAIERGGDLSFHEPGQLVAYPVIYLKEELRDLKRFLTTLEGVIVAALADFSVNARVIPGSTGVWVNDFKIASIGIAVRRWVTYHGFAVNIHNPLAVIAGTRPCGFEPEVMTTLARLCDPAPSLAEVQARIKIHALALLGPYAT